MKLICNGHKREYDLQSIASAFFPGQAFNEGLPIVESTCFFDGDDIACVAKISDEASSVSQEARLPFNSFDSQRRVVKDSFYKAAVSYTGIAPPWGEFSGIRPMKYLWGLDKDIDAAEKKFIEDLRVSPDKAKLCKDALNFRNSLGYRFDIKDFSLYVSIPFCPSRCSYCSFISQAAEKMHSMLPGYLNLLHKEIRQVSNITKISGYKLRSVYIGGGTPAVLSCSQLEALLKEINECFNLSDLYEFTVELGRPDAITDEKLNCAYSMGVDRISINPQTLNDFVLKNIGRKHSAEQFYNAYNLAAKYNFKVVNTDIIVGLPGDTPETFNKTLTGILNLSPENITVHSLCLKKSAWLKVDKKTEFLENKNAIQMLENAINGVARQGYLPYYIYKQKNAIGALENTGFCRDNKASYYNIAMMDELETVIGVGAGSASKLMYNGGFSRIYNHKYPFEYLQKQDRMQGNINEISEFFKNVLK